MTAPLAHSIASDISIKMTIFRFLHRDIEGKAVITFILLKMFEEFCRHLPNTWNIDKPAFYKRAWYIFIFPISPIPDYSLEGLCLVMWRLHGQRTLWKKSPLQFLDGSIVCFNYLNRLQMLNVDYNRKADWYTAGDFPLQLINWFLHIFVHATYCLNSRVVTRDLEIIPYSIVALTINVLRSLHKLTASSDLQCINGEIITRALIIVTFHRF